MRKAEKRNCTINNPSVPFLLGDTLAHSALLGVALGFLLGINLNLAVVAVAVTIALLLLGLQSNRQLASDTLLGILAHSALSLGLVVMAFQENVRVDLMGYMFGDILAVTATDLLWVWGGGVTALLLLVLIWRPLLALTVHEELARVEGVAVTRVQLVFMLMIALVIAVSMKIVGVLLITSMMIIQQRRHAVSAAHRNRWRGRRQPPVLSPYPLDWPAPGIGTHRQDLQS